MIIYLFGTKSYNIILIQTFCAENYKVCTISSCFYLKIPCIIMRRLEKLKTLYTSMYSTEITEHKIKKIVSNLM